MTLPQKIQTAFTKMFGIRYPIISAPMFLISNADMIVAVGEAGGLGAMPALNKRTSEEFETTLKEIKSRTQAPFGINLILMGNDRLPADTELCIKYKVPLIITSLGDPTETIQKVHSYGGKVFCDVINLRHALKAKQAGADGLIAVSVGAGGHAGKIAANVLIPWLVKETQLPVLASGCISNGAQIHSALSLGACAAYLGTRFITTKEAPAPEDYKKMILNSSPEDIVLSPKVTGHDCNFLKASLDQFESNAEGLARWRDVWSAGQGVGLIQDIPSIAELMQRLASEYAQSVERISQSIS